MEQKLDLPLKYKTMLKGIFQKHIPGVEVLVYGSRVNGQSHPASDLDLALKAPDLKQIPTKKLNALKEALVESSIPFLVEARDYALLPKSFHQEIEKNYIVLVSAKKE